MAEDLVPGKWRCSKCEFVLLSNFLDASSGRVAADNRERGEYCPNGCGIELERLTWKQEAEAGYESILQLLEENKKLREQLNQGH